MSEQVPRFRPGEDIPVFAAAQIFAGRFIAITGAKTSAGDYPAQHAEAGEEHPFGVAEYDSGPTTQAELSVERRVNTVRPKAIARVVCGAEVKVKELVKVGAGGKAIPLGGSGTAVGRALTTATTDNIAEIELF